LLLFLLWLLQGEVDMEKYIIVSGNVVDGFEFYGPFDTHEEAQDVALEELMEWHIATLQSP
jgi:hypothetical protein